MLHQTKVNDIRTIIGRIGEKANLLADALQDDSPI